MFQAIEKFDEVVKSCTVDSFRFVLSHLNMEDVINRCADVNK